ncbi:MAG: sulfurtransferase TusA family protein [Sulfolobaceae archaeon]
MSQYKIYKTLDLTGSSCAGPIGELAGVLEELRQGEAVEVIFADEATKKDAIAFASRKGFKVLKEEKLDKGIKLVIGK